VKGGALRRLGLRGLAGALPSSNRPLLRPQRRKPTHFPTGRGRVPINHYFPHCMHRPAKTAAGERGCGQTTHRRMAGSELLACRSLLIMPDHIYLFCAPNTFPPQPLKNWISFWRNHVTRAWPQRDEPPLWQRDYWDRQLRCDESYAQKWEYMENNPVCHGHVASAQDWPIKVRLIFWNGTIDDFFKTPDEGPIASGGRSSATLNERSPNDH
jgi:REP element-mobilizing transposase RayT